MLECKKSSAEAASFPDLPQEILLEILWRLPVKSLARFASVSKSWKSLVSSRPFVLAHLKRALGRRDSPPLLLLRHYSLTHKEDWNALYVDGETLVENERLLFPGGLSETFYYVGSCNGLLCFADYIVNHLKIVLWNPSLRKLLRLPIAHEESVGSTHTYVVGFGFDEKCDEYKFMRLVYTWSKNWSRTLPKKVEIYELRMKDWRSVDMDVPYVIPESSAQVFLNGSIHWIGFRILDEGIRGARPLLVVFDLHEETFREMGVPDGMLFANTLNLSITIHQGSLCLFQCHPLMPDGHQLHGICWVWLMREYGAAESWTKLFAIDICELGGIVRVIGFRKHGEVLLITPNDELVSYNPESQKISRLGLYGVANSFEVVNYVESLTLLETQNSAHATASHASFC
ncbi:hypothetical protein MLD38_014165 [Melastoma candidum]|uniref:Uncharacterized protein n=1 Tax=Melastoma candidum TaxID=119954 RepID=A0ACB9RD76_9MYRT|nr:hypothetical protein MLD38_014165 [Melastoma candidum]